MNAEDEGDAMEAMTMDPKKLELIKAQKTRVCDLAREGSDVHAKIHKARDRERYDLWNEKRSVGDTARWALLTYAFLRGQPYRNVEPKCRELHAGQAADVQAAVRKGMARQIMDGGTQPLFDAQELIETWLAVPETEARKAKRTAAEAKGRAAREVRRKTSTGKRSAA